MKKKPEISGPCVCAQMRKATRVATQVYDTLLKPSGLRVTQYSLMANIKKHGEITVTRLAYVMMMDQTTVTRNLKPLEKKGFIHLRKGKDLRVKNISLTDVGLKIMDEARPYWERAQGYVTSGLGSKRTEQFLSDLEALITMSSKS